MGSDQSDGFFSGAKLTVLAVLAVAPCSIGALLCQRFELGIDRRRHGCCVAARVLGHGVFIGG
jgi:hypothetical protein